MPINYAMFDMKSQGRLKLEQLALSRIRYYVGGRIAVIDVTQSLIDSIEGIDSEDVGALSAIPRQIEGVDIGICIKEKTPGFSQGFPALERERGRFRYSSAVRRRRPCKSRRLRVRNHA